MYYLGIDIGASSVKVAAVNECGDVLRADRQAHLGSPLPCLAGVLASLEEAGFAKDDCAAFVCTGSGAEMLQAVLPGIAVIEDVPALVRGVQALAPEARSIIQMGAQSALYVTGFADGHVPEFAMNESCAAGTGSFFEDQMARLGLPLESYSEVVSQAETVPRLSGRCSVFAKTDIIHRQQEGVPVQDILQGLCHATVKAFKATIVRNLPVQAPIALAGGTLLNAGVVRAVREVFKLEEGQLFAGPELVNAQAVGAALEASASVSAGAQTQEPFAHGPRNGANFVENDTKLVSAAEFAQTPAAVRQPALSELRCALENTRAAQMNDLARLPQLPQVCTTPSQGFALAPSPWNLQGTPATVGGPVPAGPALPEEGELLPVILGVDVGSTSTNLVLLSTDGALLDAQYLRTRGNPKQVVRDGLAVVQERIAGKAHIVAIGVTGSGRSMIGEMLGAGTVRDEITAQARAAVQADPAVDTVFEIGGQDSKYISLSAGQVADFQMNKVCAAGTGSFVEEQAGRLGIALPDYGELALSAAEPVDLGERCTVFVETAINAALAKGASKADVAAGLCLSVVRNYLHKVVGTKPVGSRIVLQGGVAYNPAIVAAFKAYAGDALTVSPWFAVSGAVGAALLAIEDQGLGAAPVVASAEEIELNRKAFYKTDELYLEGYDPTRDPAKKTVGIPRALMIHKLFPMLNAFFKTLGFNVYLTNASSEATVQLAQQYAQGETCYPVKLMHGHMAELLDAGVDYVFMPSMHTIRHAKSVVPHNYACTYMQSMPPIIAKELDYEGHGITLINPQMNLDFGQAAIAEVMLSVGAALGKNPQETAKAMLAGGVAVNKFTIDTEKLGDDLLASLKPGERVICLVTRNYGIVDPALNMGIPDLLLDRGQKVITISHLHAHDLGISADYPGVVWPFGEHIISAVKMIARDPRLFAVYLTNHGCGPDTMLTHLVAEEMGDKPYLQIEMDEHYSKVGVETRVEAFLNAIRHYEAADLRDVPTSTKVVNTACNPLRADEVAGLPSFGPYGALTAEWLRGRGFTVEQLVPTADTLDLGRKETTSKEYYSFASLLGLSVAAAREGRVKQLLLPSSQGGEADSQFDRVVASVLNKRGYGDVRVIAPDFELLSCNLDSLAEGSGAEGLDGADGAGGAEGAKAEGRGHGALSGAEAFFVRLLAGDVVQAAPPEVRETVLAELAAKPSLSLDDVIAVAEKVAQAAAARPAAQKKLALVGEWPLAVSDELNGGLGARLEAEGYRVLRMPFAEYLWFAWNDGCEEGAKEKVIGGPIPMMGETAHSLCNNHEGETTPEVRANPLFGVKQNVLPQDEWHAQLDSFAAMMQQISQALGDASPYSVDLAELRALAKDALGMLASGNGRYRYAKAVQLGRSAQGVIMTASTYENTDIMLRLKGIPSQAPLIHLAFDGALDQGIEDRLNSFLYYL